MRHCSAQTRLHWLYAAKLPMLMCMSWALGQEALQVPEGEVQAWVVRAIGRRLLAARMNQTTAQLTVSRVTRAQFGPADWGVLHSQLSAWQVSHAVHGACM